MEIGFKGVKEEVERVNGRVKATNERIDKNDAQMIEIADNISKMAMKVSSLI